MQGLTINHNCLNIIFISIIKLQAQQFDETQAIDHKNMSNSNDLLLNQIKEQHY